MVGIATFAMFCGDKQLVEGLAVSCDFVGICLVAADLLNIYRKHRVDGPIARLKSYFRDRPWRKKERIGAMSVNLRGHGSINFTGQDARLTVGASQNATIEQKVDFLMRRFKELEEGQQNHQSNLALAEQRLTAGIAASGLRFDHYRKSIERRLRSIEVGDLFLTPLGLLYVAVGAALNILALLS